MSEVNNTGKPATPLLRYEEFSISFGSGRR